MHITNEVTSHLKSLQRLIIIVIIRRYIEEKRERYGENGACVRLCVCMCACVRENGRNESSGTQEGKKRECVNV